MHKKIAMMRAQKHDQIQFSLEATMCVVFRLRSLRALFMTGFLCALVFPIHAMDLPDAGSILRKVDPRNLPSLPKGSSPMAPEVHSKESLNDVTTMIEKYEFMGNSLLDDLELSIVAKDFLKHHLGNNPIPASYRNRSKWFFERNEVVVFDQQIVLRNSSNASKRTIYPKIGKNS